MLEQKLPNDLRGDWIWLSNPHSEQNKYCYFRHDINLDQTPREAELRIAAFSTFHLFINGRHIYFGESGLNKTKTYVHVIDVSFCLQPGNNLISISVFNSNESQVNRFSHEVGGLWAELQINKESRLCTSKNWYVRSADCLYSCNLYQTSRGGFTEKLDFNKVVSSWIHSSDFEKDHWGHPDRITPIQEMIPYLAPDTITGIFCTETHFKKAVSKGKILRHNFSSCSEYSEIMKTSGTYVSEGFFYADSAGPVDYSFFSDAPYKLYLNDKLIKENAVKSTVNGEAPLKSWGRHEFDAPRDRMRIADGWNKICVVQQLDQSSYGFTLNIDADPIQFNILRTHENDALPGWTINGPLNTPLDRCNGVIWPDKEKSSFFYSITPIDESAFHESLRFKASEDDLEDIQLDSFTINPEEFIVLDLGQIHYALPQLTIEGAKGDIVDIVCANRLTSKKYLAPFGPSRSRNVNSVILDGTKNRWIDFHPRGFRYMMIVARRTEKPISIRHINAKTISRDFVEQGFLESSDRMLNMIWQNSVNTLEANVNFRILDGAGREHTQYISDCMIQSMVGFLARGDYQSSLKALREFAAASYETGEIPAMHPTSVPFHILDMSLLYPEWVRQHYMYTGDKAFLEEFEPVLYKLFSYLQTLELTDQGVIFTQPGSNEYFIDLNIPAVHGVSTALNSLYSRALLNGAILMEELGRKEYATRLQKKANTVANVIQQICWDENKKQFSDFWYNNELSPNYSWQANILAIFGGVATEKQTTEVLNNLFSMESPFGLFIDESFFTPYFMHFVQDALFAKTDPALGLNFMRYFWGGILGADNQRTWPELFAPRNPEQPTVAGNLSMGYSTSPVIYIVKDIVGITPTKAGYSEIFFNPAIELIDELKAQIPTVDGAIYVSWQRDENGDVILELGANHPVKVTPHFASDNEIEVEFRISDNITISE